jgi:CBS domain-containing protein
MNVGHVMNRKVRSCRPEDTLNRAAQLMWENTCGAIPVVDAELKPVGFLTDRDICMAAYTQGKTLAELKVDAAMARKVICCAVDDDLNVAMKLMAKRGLRRLPVVGEGGKLVGILSLDDLACESARGLRGGVNRELREWVGEVWIAINKGKLQARV